MSFTTFIPHTTTAFISRHRTRTPFTPLCIFRTLQMLRPTRTQNHLLPPILLRLLCIAMLLHVPGPINPADIFTKEMRDGAHFWRMQDSFMCPLSNLLQQSLFDVHLSHQQAEPHLRQVVPSAASSCAFASKGSFLLALCSSLLSQTLDAISHLSSAGRHIIRSLH